MGKRISSPKLFNLRFSVLRAGTPSFRLAARTRRAPGGAGLSPCLCVSVVIFTTEAQRGGAATQTRLSNASHKEAQNAQKGIPFVLLVPFCGQENLVSLKNRIVI